MDKFDKLTMNQDLGIPQISILVPVYNVEKYLRRCIDSVIKQDFQDWEMVLVDDGSPDKSPLICDEYSSLDKRIKTVHKTNGGLPSARLVGFQKAKGKYLVFLDSDDFLLDNALSILYAKIEEGYDMVRAGYRMIQSENESEDIRPKILGEIIGMSNFRRGLLNGKIDPFMWGMIVKRECLAESCFIPVLPFSVGEDTLTSYLFSRKIKKLFVLDSVLYGYFMDWNSIMHQKVASHLYLDKMYVVMKKTLYQHELKDRFLLRCYTTAQHINYSFYQEVGFDIHVYNKYVHFIEKNGTNELKEFLSRNFYVFGINLKCFHYWFTKFYGYLLLYHRWKGHKRKIIY